MPAFCPLCASDERTTEEHTADGRRFAVCEANYHGTEPYVWETTPPERSRTRCDGLGSDLDIWDKLFECVPADGAIHSYGDLEDIFFAHYSRDAAVLQERCGHRWRDGKKSESQFSMSVYLAARLSELADEGLLVKSFAAAEGPWAYNGIIFHWKRA